MDGFTSTSVYLREQLQHVLNLAFEETFPALKARSFIPVNSTVPETAETVLARIWGSYGEAKIINSSADDLPSVTIGQKEASLNVKTIGCSFEYSVMDLKRSQATGVNLDGRMAIAARQLIETQIDKLSTHGDERYGLRGLCNNDDIEPIKLSKWFDDKGKSLKTGEQMLNDISQLITSVVTKTNSIMVPDTLLLPIRHYAHLALTPFSQYSQITLLNYLLTNNPYVKNIDSWVHLEDQCILYPRTPQALEMFIPMDFATESPQAVGLSFKVQCHSRFGGVQIYTPKACAYGRGI